MKSTKKSFLLSMLSLVLCLAMLLGTTWAWFTDEVTSGVNQIKAGNLDIEVYHTNETGIKEKVGINTTLFDKVTNWEPGVVVYENISIENVGNLAAKVKLNVTDVAKNKMDVGDYDLTQVIKVVVKEGGFTGTVTRDSITSLAAGEDVKIFDFKAFAESFNLAGKNGETVDSKTYGIAMYWQPTENDNNWNRNNGKASSDGEPLWIKFGLNVVATQNTVEEDSFDDQYDAQATFPVLAAVVNESESYSGNFTQNKNVEGGESTQVTAKEDIKLAGSETETLIPAGTTLFKANGANDEAITTSNDSTGGYAGSIVSNIKTTESTSASVTYQISYTYKEGETETSVSKFSNIVTNVFDVSTGLKNVKVSTIHNGGTATELQKVDTKPASPYDQTFYYDSANGKLYIYSSKYSDFKVTYDYDFAAAVAGQGYATFEAAIDAAKNSDTVTLLKDITISKRTEINNKNITLNANGKTVNYTTAGDNVLDHEGMIRILGGSNVTVTGNGKFTYTGATWKAGYCFMVYGNSKLTIKNGTYNAYCTVAQAGGGPSGSVTGGTVEIKDGDFTTTEVYDDKLWTLNKKDNTGSVIQVYGGTFRGFDPSNGNTENPNDNFVAEGYIAKQNGNVWTVEELPDPITLTLTGIGEVSGEIGGHTFILQFSQYAQSQIAPGHDSASLTIAEVTEAAAATAWKVTYPTGIKYYTFVMDEGYVTSDNGDPSASIYVKDATAVEPGANTVMNMAGYGGPASIGGFEGDYFMIGAIYTK